MILKAVYGPADGSTPANAALLTENPGEVLDTLPGFKLDHVLEADGPRHGSWICMANDSKGRLLLGGQGGQPITRVTLLNGKSMLDEILHIPVTETMGMLFVDKVLYLNGSGSKGFGLYRCWFTDDGVNFNNGASFDGFVRNALAEVKASMSPAELAAMGDLTKVQSAIATPPAPRAFVKEWTTADLLPLLDKVGKGRDFARGKAAFTSAQCILCHRYGDQGGATGPDLTNVATRFKRQDLLESITEPSKVLSEQYMMTVFTMKDGTVTAGRISQENADTVVVMTNPFDTATTATVSKADVKSRELSKVSLMPPGLFNTFKEDEILDLLAYLESMGDEKHPNFSK